MESSVFRARCALPASGPLIIHVVLVQLTARTDLVTKSNQLFEGRCHVPTKTTTMPRGKNYVNNNKGVSLQANAKALGSMRICEYGAGCTRPDCIYRHEGIVKRDEVCLPFLAGKCTFKDSGCRKRHPKKDEKDRLLAKYKRTRCRFGDECYTDGCLYAHPREVGAIEPSYIEPHHIAFPPLNDATAVAVPRAVTNSAWKAAPLVVPPTLQPQLHQQPIVPVAPVQQLPMENDSSHTWSPMEAQMYAPYFAPAPYFDPSMHGYPTAYYGAPMAHYGMPHAMHFNADAEEFVPGNPMA